MALMSADKSCLMPHAEAVRASAYSIPGLFDAATREHGRKTAMRWKRPGIWEAVTWADDGAAVHEVDSALKARGIERGERVAILSENRPEWLFADLGALRAGCVSVGLDVHPPLEQLVELLNDCSARLLFVDSELQLQ